MHKGEQKEQKKILEPRMNTDKHGVRITGIEREIKRLKDEPQKDTE